MTKLTHATRKEGIFYGLAAFTMMFFVGGFLTATMFGAIIGIPLIMASLWCLMSSPWAYRKLLAAPCPHCGARCVFPPKIKARKCSECKLRVLVRGDELKKIEDCEGRS